MNYDDNIVAHCTLDRKHATLLYTAYNAQPVFTGKLHWQTKEPIEHSKIIHLCNKYMGGVDCNDQLMKYSAFSHRTCKWWKKVLFRLLNLAMVNASSHIQNGLHSKERKNFLKPIFELK